LNLTAHSERIKGTYGPSSGGHQIHGVVAPQTSTTGPFMIVESPLDGALLGKRNFSSNNTITEKPCLFGEAGLSDMMSELREKSIKQLSCYPKMFIFGFSNNIFGTITAMLKFVHHCLPYRDTKNGPQRPRFHFSSHSTDRGVAESKFWPLWSTIRIPGTLPPPRLENQKEVSQDSILHRPPRINVLSGT
jgi:hypothetical protein